jgi:hypothetical protein
VLVTPIGRIVFTGLLFSLSTIVMAQDRHLGLESTGVLYARSAFAHGYIHGYELGFHSGDLDIQFGRDPRDPASLPLYKRPCAAYHTSFGSKDLFKIGFEDGFRAGYSDVVRGLSFQAVVSFGKAADRMNVPAQQAASFDGGFKEGYEAGRRQGSNDGRNLAVANPINPPCLGLPGVYCDAFERAFQIGYADGYGNQSARHSAPEKLQASAQ